MSKPKYLATADTDGRWSVLDVAADLPACVDGIPQVGLSQDEAEDIAMTLNAMLDDDDG